MLICLVLLFAILLGARDTPVGKGLHRLLVEKPAAFLSHIRLLNVVAIAAIAAATAWLVATFGGEGARFAMMGVPEAVAWLAAFDITAFVEVFGAVLLVAAMARLKLVSALAARLMTMLRRPRARRAVRARRGKLPAKDDEDPAFPAYALAA